jgi:hypothetical protein
MKLCVQNIYWGTCNSKWAPFVVKPADVMFRMGDDTVCLAFSAAAAFLKASDVKCLSYWFFLPIVITIMFFHGSGCLPVYVSSEITLFFCNVLVLPRIYKDFEVLIFYATVLPVFVIIMLCLHNVHKVNPKREVVSVSLPSGSFTSESTNEFRWNLVHLVLLVYPENFRAN